MTLQGEFGQRRVITGFGERQIEDDEASRIGRANQTARSYFSMNAPRMNITSTKAQFEGRKRYQIFESRGNELTPKFVQEHLPPIDRCILTTTQQSLL